MSTQIPTSAIRPAGKSSPAAPLLPSGTVSRGNGQPTVDVRGPRFAAWVTTVVLAAALLLSAASSIAAALILGVQAVVFAVGALGGPRRHPYGQVFARVVAPRLGPVTEREPVAPLRFAQLVGLIFAVAATAGFGTGLIALGLTATAAALIAALLNAAFGVCLGCQLYPLFARLGRTPHASRT